MSANSKNMIALPSDIKRTNRRNVLQVLRRGEPVAASDICDETGLSHPTVMKALQEFTDTGVIRSLGFGSTTSRGGKKPEMFVFADMRELLCISIWPESFSVSHCRLIEEVHDFQNFPFNTAVELDEVISRLKEILEQYLDKYGISKQEIYAVSVNVPGTVDYDNHMINFNVKAPIWGKHIQITKLLKDFFTDDTLFYVDNAGKAVGRALLSDHTEYLSKRLLTVFSSWGISSCMIDKGHVLNGKDALIGEIGHMIVSDSAMETCVCGKRGCLESLVRIQHIRALLRERGMNVDDEFTFKQMFELSAKGDISCRAISHYLAHYFAVILHNLALTYNQEVVVFQGDFAWADEAFDTTLKRELNEFVYFKESEMMSIVYDRRELTLLAARGDTDRMKTEYFRMTEPDGRSFA